MLPGNARAILLVLPLLAAGSRHEACYNCLAYPGVSGCYLGILPGDRLAEWGLAKWLGGPPTDLILLRKPENRICAKGVAFECGTDSARGKIAVPLRRA